MKTVFLSRPAGALKRSIATLCAAALLVQPVAAAAAEVTTTYTYDEARTGAHNVGQLTSVSNAAATIRYDHDERGNVTSQRWEVDGTTYTQTFTYAPHDEILRRTFADGDVIPSASSTYQYDGAGLLKSIPGLITDVSRNANFDPVMTTYGNGVTETRSYDPNRQWLLSITAQSGQTTLFEESYTRSDKGLITDVVSNRTNGDWQYGYDTADRLTSATNLNDALLSQTFQYDAADNLTFNSAVGTYTYPAPAAPQPHAVQQAGGQTYTYDLNGNMIAGAGRTITYDGEDRPVSITSNGQTTDFVYGPDGARLKKTTGGNTTLYLGADEEISPDGTHIKHPLSDVRKSGSDINWMHRDHLSSVKLMSDASGAVIAENFYKPYGERSDVQITPPGTPRESKGWIGERDDPETGLTYLNARYYDPVLARFISADWFDPQDPAVGTNRYAYAANNPIWLKDPSGNSLNPGNWDGGEPLRAGSVGYQGGSLNLGSLLGGSRADNSYQNNSSATEGAQIASQTFPGIRGFPPLFGPLDPNKPFPGYGNLSPNELAEKLTPKQKSRIEQLTSTMGRKGRFTLIHYTSKENLTKILLSGKINPSLFANNPNDARYGDGQYFSDIRPGTRTNGSLSAEFLGIPFQGKKFEAYIEVDLTDLPVKHGRPHVYVVPNQMPLDLSGRVIEWGNN